LFGFAFGFAFSFPLAAFLAFFGLVEGPHFDVVGVLEEGEEVEELAGCAELVVVVEGGVADGGGGEGGGGFGDGGEEEAVEAVAVVGEGAEGGLEIRFMTSFS
jgi:hypothetical protein